MLVYISRRCRVRHLGLPPTYLHSTFSCTAYSDPLHFSSNTTFSWKPNQYIQMTAQQPPTEDTAANMPPIKFGPFTVTSQVHPTFA